MDTPSVSNASDDSMERRIATRQEILDHHLHGTYVSDEVRMLAMVADVQLDILTVLLRIEAKSNGT